MSFSPKKYEHKTLSKTHSCSLLVDKDERKSQEFSEQEGSKNVSVTTKNPS
jgi:hypothetical protein